MATLIDFSTHVVRRNAHLKYKQNTPLACFLRRALKHSRGGVGALASRKWRYNGRGRIYFRSFQHQGATDKC